MRKGHLFDAQDYFLFALSGNTRVALKLNTRTFGKTKWALGSTRGALGPSVRGTLGAL